MSKYKVIAFDMDGTLLDSRKKVRPESIRAIRAAKKAGKEVVLSTGRCVIELEDFFREVTDIRYAVTTSGAVLYDGLEHQVLETFTFEPEMVRRILDLAEGRDLMVHMLLPDASVAQKNCIAHMDHYSMGVYQPMFEQIATGVDRIRDFYESVQPAVPKINFYHPSPMDRKESERLAEAIDTEKIYAETASLEFTPKGVSKSFGLEVLCRRLGVTMDEVIAVGDSENDLSMLQAAGFAIAMGNAKEVVKKAADAIVADNDSNGCAQAIEQYLL